MIRTCPISSEVALAFVRKYHRHSTAKKNNSVYVGLTDHDGRLRGVGIMGWPVARMLHDGLTLEISRVCTDGVDNGCSMIYGALSRIAKSMGARSVVTYTLKSENGASLRAAGFSVAAESQGGSWSSPSRPRRNLGNSEDPKLRWEKTFKRHGIRPISGWEEIGECDQIDMFTPASNDTTRT